MGSQGKFGLITLLIGLAIGGVLVATMIGDMAQLYGYAADPEAQEINESIVAEGLRRRAFIALGAAAPLVALGSYLMFKDRLKRMR